MPATSMDQLVSLCKRRGFIFQSADIYGGLQGVYDFGPLGVELKNNLKAAWWRSMIYERDDVEGLDASILTHQKVLHYSGHEATFTDPLTDCKKCKNRFRADHIKDGKCPNCGSTELTEPRMFNLMFKTTVGPIEDGSNFAYLRPETAQAIFTQFKNVVDSTARKAPFGIAQIGKSFRNEITPRNFIFRVREFEQMELEYFVKPGTDEEWLETWKDARIQWWLEQGLNKDKLKVHTIEKEELAHYSKATYDLEYEFPHGLEELEGIADCARPRRIPLPRKADKAPPSPWASRWTPPRSPRTPQASWRPPEGRRSPCRRHNPFRILPPAAPEVQGPPRPP